MLVKKSLPFQLLLIWIFSWIVFGISFIAYVDFHIKYLIFLCIGILLVIICGFDLKRKHTVDDLSIYLVGFFLRLFFIQSVHPYWCQHDLGNFPSLYTGQIAHGHCGYMSYLFFYKQLPDFSPVDWQSFYQPPIHYVLEAIWMWINSMLGISEEMIIKNTMFLPLIYTTFTIWVWCEIIKKLNVDKKIEKCLVFFFNVFPYFIFSAGNINNDALAWLLASIVILYLLKWNETENFKDILFLALFLGMSILTKIQLLFLGAGICVFFLEKLIKKHEKILMVIKQYLCFGLIAVPIGLSYSIYNYVRWEIPFGYVQTSFVGDIQSTSTIPLYRRFLMPTIECLCNPFMEFQMGDNQDATMWLANIKTALFCDIQWFSKNQIGYYIALGLLWITIATMFLLVVSVIYRFIVSIKQKSLTDQSVLRIFGIVQTVVFIIAHVYLYIRYKYVCSCDFRYVTINLLLLYICLFDGYVDGDSKEIFIIRWNSFMAYILAGVSLMFYLVLLFAV